MLNGRREGALRRTAESIDPARRRVAIVAGDIGDPKPSRRIIATAVQRFGGVDVLFNNAGIFRPKPFLDVTPAEFNDYLHSSAATTSRRRPPSRRCGNAAAAAR